jgi:hypothetical protein
MPVSLDIMEEGRIIRVVFVDPFKAADMYPLFQQDKIHRDKFQQEHPRRKVHLLVNFLQVTRNSPSMSHATSGSIVVIGANSLTRSVIDAILRVTHFDRTKFFNSEEEAITYLRKVIANGDKRLSQTVPKA